MLWLSALLPSMISRVLVIGLLIVAFGGWCVKKGIDYESGRRDAIDATADQQAGKDFFRALSKGVAAVKELQATSAKNTELQRKLTERIRHARNADLAVPSCPTRPAHQSASVAVVDAPACFVTRYFVGMWDDSWRGGGDGAKPIHGDPAGVTPEERKATAIGPRELLENQQVNAVSCSADRARLDRLVDLIDALELDWEETRR